MGNKEGAELGRLVRQRRQRHALLDQLAGHGREILRDGVSGDVIGVVIRTSVGGLMRDAALSRCEYFPLDARTVRAKLNDVAAEEAKHLRTCAMFRLQLELAETFVLLSRISRQHVDLKRLSFSCWCSKESCAGEEVTHCTRQQTMRVARQHHEINMQIREIARYSPQMAFEAGLRSLRNYAEYVGRRRNQLEP